MPGTHTGCLASMLDTPQLQEARKTGDTASDGLGVGRDDLVSEASRQVQVTGCEVAKVLKDQDGSPTLRPPEHPPPPSGTRWPHPCSGPGLDARERPGEARVLRLGEDVVGPRYPLSSGAQFEQFGAAVRQYLRERGHSIGSVRHSVQPAPGAIPSAYVLSGRIPGGEFGTPLARLCGAPVVRARRVEGSPDGS